MCTNSVVHAEHLPSSGGLGYLQGRGAHVVSPQYGPWARRATCLPRVLEVRLDSSGPRPTCLFPLTIVLCPQSHEHSCTQSLGVLLVNY